MSWSFYGVGKPVAVANKAKTDLSRVTCLQPEEGIKAKVLDIIETAMAAYPADAVVQIRASGSQSLDSTKPGVASNTLSVSIEQLYGFVE